MYMNILFMVGKDYPPTLMGGSIYIKKITEHLEKKGHKIYVITTSIKGISYKWKKENNIYVLRIPYMIFSLFFLYNLKFDIINSSVLNSINPIVGILVTKLYNLFNVKKVKFMLTPLHHTEMHWWLKFYSFHLLKAADGLLVSTPYEKEYYIKNKIKHKKIYIIGEGVDYKNFELTETINEYVNNFNIKFNSKNNNHIVLWLGNRWYFKGYYHLILSMKYVWSKIPNTLLVIVGPIRDSEVVLSPKILNEIKDIRAEYGEKIFDLGIINEKEKIALLHIIDVLVLPSLAETIPLTFLESWSVHKPVIGTNIPSIKSIMDEDLEKNVLVKFGDVEEIGQKIINALLDKSMREKLGEIGYNRVINNLNWDSVTEKLLVAYQDVSTVGM